jgi:hypothetical protein
VSSALSVAASDASRVWNEVTDANGAQETGLVEYLAGTQSLKIVDCVLIDLGFLCSGERGDCYGS